MKAAITVFVLCLACGIGNAAAAGPRGGSKPVDCVRSKFEAVNRHDADTIEKIYATGAILHSPDHPELAGNKPIADTYRSLFEAIPDAKVDIQTLENTSQHVYAQFVLTGHLKGGDDKPIRVRIISVYAVKGDHIVEDTTYYDRKMP
jgi:ketosteroid isomerase-like protein